MLSGYIWCLVMWNVTACYYHGVSMHVDFNRHYVAIDLCIVVSKLIGFIVVTDSNSMVLSIVVGVGGEYKCVSFSFFNCRIGELGFLYTHDV